MRNSVRYFYSFLFFLSFIYFNPLTLLISEQVTLPCFEIPLKTSTLESGNPPNFFALDHCIMYKQCGDNPKFPGRPINCVYTGQAKELDDPTAVQLKKICPELVEEIESGYGKNKIKTCCDSAQVIALSLQLSMGEALLQRCPACVHNFRQTFCHLTCSPVQSRFMEKNATFNFNETGQSGITKLHFYMSRGFADNVFSSCQSVAMPSTNDKALSIMCGPYGAYYCSPDKWFNYMGSTSNGFAPFDIVYVMSNKSETQGFTPFNRTTIPCNETVKDFDYPCSCMDCVDSCPVPAPWPPLAPPFTIIGVDGLSFIVSLVFIFFASMFVSFYFFRCKRGSDDDLNMPLNDQSDVVDGGPSFLQKKGMQMEVFLERSFCEWGKICAEHSWTVLIVGALIAIGLSTGILFLKVTTDPVELWAAPGSRSRLEKEFFDTNFVPFYRTEMMIVKPVGVGKVPFHGPNGTEMWGPVFNMTFLEAVLELQNNISTELVASYHNVDVHLNDICFKPLSPLNNECTIQSVLNYFQNDPENLHNDKYLDHIQNCMRNPLSPMESETGLPCLAEFGGPVFPYTTLGGYLNGSKVLGSNPPYTDATALVIVFVVNNDKNNTGMALAWEKVFLEYMKNFSHPLMDIAYSAERAIEDELERESRGDVLTILLSYIVMFVYISVALGNFSSCRRFLTESKLTLGLGGVLIVLVSVSASVGVFGFVGVPATLIIIEVIPFLVLAVGVDNMFILVQSYQREPRSPSETKVEHLGRVVGQVAPSILLAGASEAACFFLGSLSDMPAVHAFSLYAGLALVIDVVLQLTCFVSLLALDIAREEKNRLDLFCCFKTTPKEQGTSYGVLFKFVKRKYSSVLLSKGLRPVVMLGFTLWLAISIVAVPKITVGLDQELSMPEDSFVLKYFKYMNSYLSVGPPVYFVLKGDLNFSTYVEQNSVCTAIDCDKDSLVTQLYLASRQANNSFIAQPASSWIDDYFDWSIYNHGSELSYPCCRVYENGTFCPSSVDDDCDPCQIQIDKTNVRPTPDSFMEYLPYFLEDVPSETCPKAGHAAYGSGVKLDRNKTSVAASYFMTYHTILHTSQDYYEALRIARKIADNITITVQDAVNDTSIEVFPYSVFYVFYEQYLTMWRDTLKSVIISIVTVFVVNLVLSGLDLWSSLINVLIISMIVTNLGGLMYCWSISLNAVSLVNLVMVLSGITLTKFGGIIVLGFAQSQIFRVFYFRMYLGMVLIGAAHGLVFLPVLLSFIGPKCHPYRSQRRTCEVIPDSLHDSLNSLNEDASPPLPAQSYGVI